jgi:hypothetical protein
MLSLFFQEHLLAFLQAFIKASGKLQENYNDQLHFIGGKLRNMRHHIMDRSSANPLYRLFLLPSRRFSLQLYLFWLVAFSFF